MDGLDGWDGWDGWILLRTLVQLEHLAVLIISYLDVVPNVYMRVPSNTLSVTRIYFLKGIVEG